MHGSSSDVVIFVHGTFANAEDDEGPRWWQRNSESWQWFEHHLPEGTRPFDEVIFHWTGRNSQVQRLEASNRLLGLMIELERQHKTYHLVGHSHGGSVIWEALTSANVTLADRTMHPDLRRALNSEIQLHDEPLVELRHDEFAPWWFKYKTRYLPKPGEFAKVRPFIELPGLRSWTTIGTPFLRHLPKNRFMVRGWPHRRFTLNPDMRDENWRLLRHSGLQLVTMVPFILFALLVFSGWFRDMLRAAPNTWYANLLTVLAAAVWFICFLALGNRSFAYALLSREHSAVRAMDRFGDRWLGLWSPDDEAIAALKWLAPRLGGHDYEWLYTPWRVRSDCAGPEVPKYVLADRLQPIAKVPITDVHLIPHVLLTAPSRVAKPVIPFYNRFLAPWAARRIETTFTRKAQGADLPQAPMVYASPWPLPLASPVSGLPDEIAAELRFAANEQAAQLGADARKLLMVAALEGVPLAREVYRGNPLVHTAYFENKSVLRLITLHIAHANGHELPDDYLARWLVSNKIAVKARFDAFLKTVLT
ncbi:hypothetical protein DFR72_103196 [Lentzea flaviverrucosa]|uniref:Alpha/beta hydrolase family protein n=2 Tax=Lentzea flaviverrucosa TaxID=200379 RepID=A0A1H9BF28_9PSEU|nr:hypothetical protein DFR72_103196 [Lentzea flaviverrucosa]SEP87469.1 hypothetical protein SAMN05216195_101462 [Lentzea flaviverrucosa]